jgi:hypothetical protein
VSYRGKAMYAIGECDSFFNPRDFPELLENECQWFEALDALRHIRWQRTSPEESPEEQVVVPMLRDLSGWLRN